MNDAAPAIPTSLAEAIPQLRLRTYGRTFHALREQSLAAAGAAEALPGVVEVAGDLLIGAALDIGHGMVPVSEAVARDQWGTEIAEVVDATLQAGLDRSTEGVEVLGEGTYRIVDEQLAASIALRPQMAAGFTVTGDSVLLAPGRGTVILTGSDDPEGLRAAAAAADQIAETNEGLCCERPLVLQDGRWQLYEWPADGELWGIVARMVRRFAVAAYGLQGELLAGGSAYPAVPQLFRAPDGRSVLVASWTRTQETLLPVVDDVVVVETDGGARRVPFAQFVEATGVEVTDLRPPRYHVAPDAQI